MDKVFKVSVVGGKGTKKSKLPPPNPSTYGRILLGRGKLEINEFWEGQSSCKIPAILSKAWGNLGQRDDTFPKQIGIDEATYGS